MSELQQQVQDVLDELVASGAETGLQVAVRHHGEPVVDAVAGTADPATGRPVTPDTPFFSYSLGKGLGASAVHVLAERGVLDYDTPLADLWPEYRAHGKDGVTLRHVLSHSAGVPGLPQGLSIDDLCDWDAMCARVTDEEPWWEPGTKVGYHAVSWGFLVGETVRRATGRLLSQVVREEVAEPLGVAGELALAVPAAEQHRLAVLADAPAPASEDGGEGWGEVPADAPMFKVGPMECTTAVYGNRSDVLAADVPAGGTATARAAARMYASLLGEVDGVRLLTPERLATATAVAASGTDQVFGMPSEWALGYSVFPAVSTDPSAPRAFGMGGVGGSQAWAIPSHGIAFALTKNLLAPDFSTADRVAAVVLKHLA